ncbi:MAG: 50S ribosomal protein L18Ae [Candidatus Methanomethylophilaceae archaeon]|nr:50S ribosomal protein L18Ae [Candidatus Methanomethylophilaceae archaeon]
MKAFRVVGTFNDARQEKGKQPFDIEIADVSAEAAKEQTLSTLGSRHKLKRWEIQIAEVTEIADADITNHLVKYKVTGE